MKNTHIFVSRSVGQSVPPHRRPDKLFVKQQLRPIFMFLVAASSNGRSNYELSKAVSKVIEKKSAKTLSEHSCQDTTQDF